MKPVRIFTHATSEPPGHIGVLINRLDIPFEQVCLEDGKQVPMDLDNVSALIFMGGPGDVNKAPDWMSQEMALIKLATAREIPILGVCLGAQLVSKALGGEVWEADHVEVGWHDVKLLPASSGHQWFDGLPEKFNVFQWHAHVFSAPSGAVSMATSECTECQAFTFGNNLAIQFHLEMNSEMIEFLTEKYSSDLVGESDCVQNREQVLRNISNSCQQTFAIADILIRNWLLSVK
ncbi:MAG: type 1 glutamine amidotransferase [Gammaproteobacteria bacterium]|nr:type 1 glutamine amidotransferase [Gammaproteobacteria bacterium]